MGRINQLAEKTTLNSTDVIAVDAGAGGNTNKMTGANLAGQLKALGNYQVKLTFDSTPTAGSTNPVTSGGVKTALDGKQSTLTFDSTPTAGSTNPVTSGGVANAIAQSTAKSTSTANVTIYTGNITAYVNKLLKCAGLVYAFLEVETTSGQTLTISDAFARIPSGWRPKVAEEFPASILQSNDIWATYKVSIGTNGDIKQLLTNTAKGVSFVAVYEHE